MSSNDMLGVLWELSVGMKVKEITEEWGTP